jgi:hypothetical protein
MTVPRENAKDAEGSLSASLLVFDRRGGSLSDDQRCLVQGRHHARKEKRGGQGQGEELSHFECSVGVSLFDEENIGARAQG